MDYLHLAKTAADMTFFQQVWDIIDNLHQYVQWWVEQLGPSNLTALIFLIIFCETGLVVMPWLPGDSLLFVAGAICGPKEGVQYSWGEGFWDTIHKNFQAIKFAALHGQLTLSTLLLLLPVAAVLGDNLNYWIGRFIGPRIFKREKSLFFNTEILHRTQTFYTRHGAKMVMLARFVPLVRTFAPFVAGVGKMNYKRFVGYGILGAFIWVFVCCSAGFLLGNIAWVKKHFEIIVVAVIIISILPAIMAWMQARRQTKRGSAAVETAGNS